MCVFTLFEIVFLTLVNSTEQRVPLESEGCDMCMCAELLLLLP